VQTQLALRVAVLGILLEGGAEAGHRRVGLAGEL
jgi:hypothetical protein